MDDNDVPELVIALGSIHYAPTELYTYHNSSIKKLGDFGSYGDFGCYLRTGVIDNSHSINGGYLIYELDRLENGQVAKIF